MRGTMKNDAVVSSRTFKSHQGALKAGKSYAAENRISEYRISTQENPDGSFSYVIGPLTRGRPQKGILEKAVKLMLRPKGATIDDICKATGWQETTARARLSDKLRHEHRIGVRTMDHKRFYFIENRAAA